MTTEPIDSRTRLHTYDSYVHANPKGTGSACSFELHPAHGDSPGSIFVSMALQKTVGGFAEGTQIFPTFDWENRIVLKLDRTDLSQIIQVLRGMKESINEGKGLFHRSARANTVIKFSHQIEPKPGYMLSVSRKNMEGRLSNCWFFFDVDEALTLMLSLEQAMIYVCLGIPEVIERIRHGAQPFSMPQAAIAKIALEQEPKVNEYRVASGDPF